MVLEKHSYAFACSCGKKHEVKLDKAVFEAGALYNLADYISRQGYRGNVAAVYDTNTYEATAGRRPKANREIVINAAGLHADEHGVAALEEGLGSADVLLAIGAGTIHDITRYVAGKRGIPFVSVPTAASVDGFVSGVCAMTWNGFKTTLPGVAPALLIADTDIIAAAPGRLAASGVGDILGKYMSLADWRIGHILTGEYYCDGIDKLLRKTVDDVVNIAGKLANGDKAAHEKLMQALIVSGVAMQLCGNSRPASGSEHHISHFLELPIKGIAKTDALHGEKVGVGTLMCASYAKNLAEEYSEDDIRAELEKGERRDFSRLLDEEMLSEVFGELTPMMLEENKNLCTAGLTQEKLAESWNDMCGVIDEMPDVTYMRDILTDLGAPVDITELGQEQHKYSAIRRWAPYVRNRLTFSRVMAYVFS